MCFAHRAQKHRAFSGVIRISLCFCVSACKADINNPTLIK